MSLTIFLFVHYLKAAVYACQSTSELDLSLARRFTRRLTLQTTDGSLLVLVCILFKCLAIGFNSFCLGYDLVRRPFEHLD